MIIHLLSYACMGIGLLFWLWGTWPLLGDRSVLYKLHYLSIADTLGSMAIVVGLLLRIPREWPLLMLALIGLALWNTVLGYVLAYCSRSMPLTKSGSGSVAASVSETAIAEMIGREVPYDE